MRNEEVARELLAAARELTAVRRYFPGCAPDIAAEVVAKGHSDGWVAESEGDRSWKAAREAEKHLAKFNIGYVDDMDGSWGFVRGGTDFFR